MSAPLINFDEHEIDALLVSALPNVRYLTGFTGSNAMALLTPDSVTLFTDPRYTIQASAECQSARVPAKVVIATKPLWQYAVAGIHRRRFKRTGFEQGRLSQESFQTITQALSPGYGLVPAGPLIDELRMVKSDAEVERIRAAVNTNSAAFMDVAVKIRPGMTEAEIAAELDYSMRTLEAEAAAFETIVAAGPRSALPHARPSRQKLEPNQLLLIDMGAAQDGYMSDMTRMLFAGKPGRKTRAIYRAVLDAQLAAIDAVRDGAATRTVDGRARDVLKAAGLDKAFVHSTGHGLGLEIHEGPRIARKDKTRLKAGMVITIEPGAYIEGFGGVRIEDTVLVTKTGCEVLTPTSKELILL